MGFGEAPARDASQHEPGRRDDWHAAPAARSHRGQPSCAPGQRGSRRPPRARGRQPRPSRRTTTSSQISRTSSSLCEMNTTARPCSRRLAHDHEQILDLWRADRLEVGSSRISSSAPSTIALSDLDPLPLTKGQGSRRGHRWIDGKSDRFGTLHQRSALRRSRQASSQRTAVAPGRARRSPPTRHGIHQREMLVDHPETGPQSPRAACHGRPGFGP